jgi:hypothetical protein
VPPIAAMIALACLVATGNYKIAQPLVLLTIVLAPALLPRTVLYPRLGDPPPPDGADSEGGGGGPRTDPPKPHDAPRGGIPLADAEPARVRVRDHDRPALAPRRPRRPAREPERTPQRERVSRSVQR